MGCGSSIGDKGDQSAEGGRGADEAPPGMRVLPNMHDLLQGARVPQADRIIPLLYLGNLAHARDKEKLQSLGIQRIVNVTSQPPPFPGDFTYENVSVEDTQGANIAAHMEQAARFVAEGIDEGEVVFVHCEMGMSRSTTIVVSYLLLHKGWSLRRSVLQIKLARPIVRVTRTFLYELMDLEMSLLQKKELDLDLLIEEGMEAAATGADTLTLTATALQMLFFPTPDIVESQLKQTGLYSPEWNEFKHKFLCGVDYQALEAQTPPSLSEIREELESATGSRQACARVMKKHPKPISPFVK